MTSRQRLITRVVPLGFLGALAAVIAIALPAGAVSVGAQCTNGMAGPYPCEKIDLAGFVTLPELGNLVGNDIWGWTDPADGKEYAIVGARSSAAFVDVTDATNPTVLGILPTDGLPDSIYWSDIKVDGHYAFIVYEGTDAGMQVFDLHRLRGLTGLPLELFDSDALYEEVSNTHNIWINEETDYAYLLGSNTCENSEGDDGGLHMVDISDPLTPVFAGCALVENAPEDEVQASNYVHDTECIVYDGPDSDYSGSEICFGANENAIVIYDVTEKGAPAVLSKTTYPGARYTHQGSLTPDRNYLIFGDEEDEATDDVPTTTYTLDVSDLDNPGTVKSHQAETASIDHNLYVHDDYIFQTNYAAGQRILQYTTEGLAEGEMTEVAFFDTLPGVDINDFYGVWSNYYFEESNTLVVSGTESSVVGLFVLKPQLPGLAPDPDPDPDPSASASCQGEEATIVGTSGDDDLKGTPGPDVVQLGRGDDRFKGRGGDDLICGGAGEDILLGGAGDDSIRGNRDADRLRGQRGDDLARGGSDADRVSGGAGDDVIRGQASGDELRGGPDDDRLNGGSSEDDLHGNSGDDRLRGGSGADDLNGGPGTDSCGAEPAGSRRAGCE